MGGSGRSEKAIETAALWNDARTGATCRDAPGSTDSSLLILELLVIVLLLVFLVLVLVLLGIRTIGLARRPKKEDA